MHPETHPEMMKKGGKKRKAKATNINEQKVNVRIDLGKPEFQKHRAITHVSRLATPNQTFANIPKTQNPSYFAVPNGIGLWNKGAAFQGQGFQGSGPNPTEVISQHYPAGALPSPAQIPNRQGIMTTSSHAQRATPSYHTTGGLMSNNPFVIAKQAEEEAEHSAYPSVLRYFKPTGRGNIPLPRAAQHSAPRAGFFPLGGQQPETREVEMTREHQPDLPVEEESFIVPRGRRTNEPDYMYYEPEYKMRTMKKGNPPHANIKSGERYIEFREPDAEFNTAMRSREYHAEKKAVENAESSRYLPTIAQKKAYGGYTMRGLMPLSVF